MRRHAFTLIELLVVVSIILVLAAILLPSLGAARESARHAICVSNKRQILVSAAMFKDDEEGLLPNTWFQTNPHGIEDVWGDLSGVKGTSTGFHLLIENGYWDDLMRSQGTNQAAFDDQHGKLGDSILSCPSAFSALRPDYYDSTTPASPVFIPELENRRYANYLTTQMHPTSTSSVKYIMFSSYAINMNAGALRFYHDISVNRGYYKRKDWLNTDTSRVAYIFELNNPNAAGYAWLDHHVLGNSGWGGFHPFVRHRGKRKVNIGFADGHVELIEPVYSNESEIPFTLQ